MKRWANHVEWHGVLIFFAFITLAINSIKNHPYLAIAIGIIGLLLFWASARSAYLYKSTTLLERYDERFFERMTAARKGAAQFLLGEKPDEPDGPTGEDDLEDVLDFFESPLAEQVSKGVIDANDVYDKFYHWIRIYYQSPVTQQYLENYYKEEPAAWGCLRDLYGALLTIEQHTVQKDKGSCSLDDLQLTVEELTKYLKQETRLRT
jgi:hypothetical protein